MTYKRSVLVKFPDYLIKLTLKDRAEQFVLKTIETGNLTILSCVTNILVLLFMMWL